MDALIVSGKPEHRARVRASLGPDWEFIEADDGVEALRHARIGGFDVVIADETSEPYGAFGLTKDLKLLSDAPGVIILLERAQDDWLARWSGADVWLLQPVDPFELSAAARALVLTELSEVADENDVADDQPADDEPAEPVAGIDLGRSDP